MTNVRAGSALDGLALSLLLINSVALAMLELFFLPLRFDGLILPDYGGTPFPVSVVVAFVTTPWLVSQTARIAVRMDGPAGFAALPLTLWFVTVIGMGLYGPGGDLVMPQDWRAIALLAAGALPSAVVLGRELAQARVARSGKPAR